MATSRLSHPYETVNPDKARRLRECAQLVTQEVYEDGTVRHVARYCRIRLCPICMWRRSRKVTVQIHNILDAIAKERTVMYIFLTLTVANCSPEDLSDTLTHMFKSFQRLTQTTAYKNAALGHCRAMEVTHNITEDTYHPHLHTLIAVSPQYFVSLDYLTQERWTSLWKRSLRVDYTPVVHVQKVKGSTGAAVAEVAKYSVKTEDYLVPDNWEMTVKTIRVLDSALHNRRFIAYAGIFKDWHQKLNLSDPDRDPTLDQPDSELLEVRHFQWCGVYNQYHEVDLNSRIIGDDEKMLG